MKVAALVTVGRSYLRSYTIKNQNCYCSNMVGDQQSNTLIIATSAEVTPNVVVQQGNPPPPQIAWIQV